MAYHLESDICLLDCRTEAGMGKIPSTGLYSSVHLGCTSDNRNFLLGRGERRKL